MHVAIQDLGLEHLWVIYPDHQEYALDEKISVIPMDAVLGLADVPLYGYVKISEVQILAIYWYRDK